MPKINIKTMKISPAKLLALAVLPAGALLLTACHSTENYRKQAALNPSLAGGAIRVESEKLEGTVQSLDEAQRTAVLALEGDGTNTYRISQGVMNLATITPGTEVKARAVDEQALFLNNAPIPAASPGVSDFKTKIWNLDRSYRLIELQYPNAETRQFKVPLGTDLSNVNPGDEVVVRSTEPLLVELRPR
jgi:hypothetical protein